MRNKIPHTQYRLGVREVDLLRALERQKLKIFTVFDTTRILNINPNNAYQLLHRLEWKNLIVRLKGGKYLLLSLGGYESEDLYTIASNLYWPSYVSFWTALSYYKLTEQLPRTVYVITTVQRPAVLFGDAKIRFVKFTSRKFFGYGRIKNMFIADKEKALLDSLLHPKYAGGIVEVFKATVNAWAEIDHAKLYEYAKQMGSKALLQRLGYFIEVGRLEFDRYILKEMHKAIGKSYVKLDPDLQVGEVDLDSEWHLILNVSEKQLFAWSEIK